METYSNTGWTPTKSNLYKKLRTRRILRKIWKFCRYHLEEGIMFGVIGVFGFVLDIVIHQFYSL